MAGESKVGEGKAGPEKTTKFGEWAKTEEGENAVAAANKLMQSEAAEQRKCNAKRNAADSRWRRWRWQILGGVANVIDTNSKKER